MSTAPKSIGKSKLEKRKRDDSNEEREPKFSGIKKAAASKLLRKPERKSVESKEVSTEESAPENDEHQKPSKQVSSQEKKSRYILYVTNIPYDATKEDIQKHFGCLKEKLVSIRMLTDKGTGQFRGTCFIDCADKESYAVALKLHHTKLLGRKIVVEPTVGGGGKGENRMQRLDRKREKFSEVRKKRIRKNKALKRKPAPDGAS